MVSLSSFFHLFLFTMFFSHFFLVHWNPCACRFKFTKILLLSETNMPDRRQIGDRHVWSEYSTCFIGDPSETDMPDRRPISDRHAWPEIVTPDQETNMSNGRSIRDLHYSDINTLQVYLNSGWIRHVGLR